MAEQEVKVIKKANLPDTACQLREAVKLLGGQAHRTNDLFVDVLLDVVERVEKLEKERRPKVSAYSPRFDKVFA